MPTETIDKEYNNKRLVLYTVHETSKATHNETKNVHLHHRTLTFSSNL